LDSLLGVLQGQTDSPPIWSFDASTAASTLTALAPQLSIPAANANIRIEQGVVVEIPAAEGLALDVPRTVSYLQADPARVLASGRLPLAMNSVAPDVVDVSQLAADARRMLTTAVTLYAYDPIDDERLEWTIGPEAWGSWLTLEAGAQDVTRLQWSHDAGAAAAFLESQLPGLGEARYLDPDSVVPGILDAVENQQSQVSTRIYHRPRQHVVQSGETLSSIGRAYGIPYPWIMQVNPGSELLQAGQTITIPSADEMLPLPVVENKRIVVSIAQQRAWVYEDEQLKWEWPVSTGIDDSPTAPGIFQIQSHEENAYASNWDLWMPHFMGIYRPVPTSDFMNGFHGFPTRNGYTLLWTGDLGRKVTYGCILLSSENAALLYDWAEEGVVVEVTP
jgi:lipoprotein-anchoring transpeptidase ErfK/SrfK